MRNQIKANDKQKSKSLINSQGSGSEYHNEHAGNVEGYGEPNTITNDVGNMTKDNVQ